MLSAASLFVALSLTASWLAADEPFADFGLETALARAKGEQKLLLVDFTASWCQPCKKMEKDTWAAAEVKAWLAENAIAIQVDVDEERELAQRFRVDAMPTVVVLRDGEEFDRVVGYKDAAALLAWARDVRAGKRSTDELRRRAEELRESLDVRARYDLAQELQRAGLNDEALAQYLWLWPATREDRAFRGVRVSFMLSDMAELAKRHAPAKEAFQRIFDELQSAVDAVAVPSDDLWREWSPFCQYFGGGARIEAWYENHRDQDGRLLVGEAGAFADRIMSDVFDELFASGRELDAVRLYADPTERADKIVGDYERMRASLPAEIRAEMEEFQQQKLVDDMSRLYGALLAAERPEQAAVVAAKLLKAIDTPEARLGLVREGIEQTGESHASFGAWLDEAEAGGGDVRFMRRKLERLRGEQADADR